MTRILIDKDGNPVRLQVVTPETTMAPAPLPRPEAAPLPVAPEPRGRSVVIRTPHGTFHGPADDLVTRQLAEFGGHTRNELAMVLSFVGEGDIVLDVGGHIGTFAVPLGRKVGPEGRVFAFEPTPSNHDYLVRNVRENGLGKTVHVERLGADDRAQRPPGNTSAAFLTEDGEGELVHTVLLDEWWRTKTRGDSHRIAMIKIDAEGLPAATWRMRAWR